MEYESEIMTELFKYAQDKLDNYFEYERVKFCKSFWENIDDDKAENISSVFKETIPSGYCSYELSSIFQGINTKELLQGFQGSQIHQKKILRCIYL